MTEPSDQVLIQRSQRGDREAVAQLYRRYAQAIARYVTYRVPDDAAIEDITAEVFLRMIEGLPQYRYTGTPFEAWLYRIAAARIGDYYRQRARAPEQALPEELIDHRMPLELDLQQREELAALRRALSQLPEEHQALLALRFVERKSLAEVAVILAKSPQAVGSEQHRALKRLAQILGTAKRRHYLRGES